MNFFVEVCKIILELVNFLLEVILQKIKKHNEEEKKLKEIIKKQRFFKYECKGDYNKNSCTDYERKIIDSLQTDFGEEFSSFFSKSTIPIFCTIRSGQEIEDYVIEKSLNEFIEFCKKKKYNVQ